MKDVPCDTSLTTKTTIFNELHRLNSEYRAELAQTDFERKVSQRGRKSSLTKNLKHLIEEKIRSKIKKHGENHYWFPSRSYLVNKLFGCLSYCLLAEKVNKVKRTVKVRLEKHINHCHKVNRVPILNHYGNRVSIH